MPNTYETKLWGGRFRGDEDALMQHFNSECWRTSWLVEPDIQGSLAHVAMQVKCGLLTSAEGETLTRGLETILADFKAGQLVYTEEYEDVHTFVELHLIRRVGDVGKKLHTARSRNDQCNVDMKLYVKQQAHHVAALIDTFCATLQRVAEENPWMMPGYTHLQRAQVVTFKYHLMAYCEMMLRDKKRLLNAVDVMDESPLGCGALAGTTHIIDRSYTAQLLGFSHGACKNFLDGVSDRDFVLEVLSDFSILMMHLSRLSEEFILWSSSEFKFIELDDSHCTGSSIMPQKKNPDICELVRGKTGRFYGHLMGVLTMMKGIPMAYDKDMQEDKEGVFDAIDNLKFALTIYAAMIDKMTVNGKHMREVLESDFSNATDMADYLAKKGLPFREAHAVVGKAVHYCIEQGKVLQQLSLQELQAMSPLFAEDIHHYLDIETCVKQRNTYNGTSPQSVARQCKAGKAAMDGEQAQIETWNDVVASVYELLK